MSFSEYVTGTLSSFSLTLEMTRDLEPSVWEAETLQPLHLCAGLQVGLPTLWERLFLFSERSPWSDNLLGSIWVSPVGYQLPPMLRKQCHIALQNYKKIFVCRLFGEGKCRLQLAAPTTPLAGPCPRVLFFRAHQGLLKI